MAKLVTEKVGTESPGRVARLREKMLARPGVCIERAYWVTKSYQETEGEPAVFRRAKALANVLNNMPVHINDGELLVGMTTSKQCGASLLPEIRWDWYEKELDTIATRPWDKFIPLTEKERDKIFNVILPYWKGKSIYERWQVAAPEIARRLNHIIGIGIAHADNNMFNGHVCPDYAKVLNKGINGIKKQIGEEQPKLDFTSASDYDKWQYLTAINITLDAVINFAKRYARLAESLAEKETDARRKVELRKIAESCNWVPANPARTFHEAVQAAWFTHMVVMNEGWGYGMSLGRPDQYLYPFYEKDIEQGRITREEARELIALLLIKMNDAVILQSSDIVRSNTGFPMTGTIVIGGVTREGKDAVNELSYLFLDAELEVRLSLEDVVIRIHKTTPDAFVMKACEVARALRGKLKFLSDETAIPMLLNDGKPIEHARDYIIAGCWELEAAGYSWDLINGFYNLPLMLDLALNNGVSRITGEQMGPKTGDPRKFKSYEEVWAAYKKQVEALLPVALVIANIDKRLYADHVPYPFLSSLYYGCVEQGSDIMKLANAPYMTRAIAMVGAPNVGDSLAAIKKAVFEEKKITMGRLVDALDKNFEGEDELLYTLKSAPKFGNDDDYVDSIVNQALVHASDVAAKYKSYEGVKYRISAGGATGNIYLGSLVGALPDGRKAGESLSEGGISPHQGRNVSGPVATMRSVAKLDHVRISNGSVLNMKINPDAVKDESKMRKFAAMIRTYCETGGYLIQFNIVDTKMLRDAQKHPEKYRDLLVRVATYSSYFVELSPELQNDIIARMEFEEV